MDLLVRWLVSCGFILCSSKRKKLKFIILLVISGTHYFLLAVNFKQGLYVYGVAGTPVCGLPASQSGEPEYQ